MTCLVIDGGTEAYYRTANMPSQTAVSACGWFKFVDAMSSAYRCAISIHGSTFYQVGIQGSSGDPPQLYLSGVALTGDATAGLVVDEWYFIAISCGSASAGDLKAYLWNSSGTKTHSVTGQGVTGTSTGLDIGNNYASNRNIAGKMGRFRCWDTVLDQAGFEAEMFSESVVRTADFNSGFLDSTSGVSPESGRNWTASGTVSQDTGDTPPVSGGGGSSSIAVLQNYYSRMRA
jgi:hypothetical protein